MSAVRILRLLEYVYETQEQADQDLSHWQVPPTGRRDFGASLSVRSSVISQPWPIRKQRIDPVGCGCTDCLTGWSRPALENAEYSAFIEERDRR